MSTVTEDSLLLTTGEVQIEASARRASPKVTIVAYTGGVMNAAGWGSRGNAILRLIAPGVPTSAVVHRRS
jgi:hypothetical protein